MSPSVRTLARELLSIREARYRCDHILDCPNHGTFEQAVAFNVLERMETMEHTYRLLLAEVVNSMDPH